MNEVKAKQDIRHSEVPLGKRVSLNLTAPHHELEETIDEFYARLFAKNEKSGDIMIIHTYFRNHEKEYKNVYHVGHEFVSMIMREKSVFTSARINIGGLACVKCRRVHFFDRVAELENIWKRDKDGFNCRILAFHQWREYDKCTVSFEQEDVQVGSGGAEELK